MAQAAEGAIPLPQTWREVFADAIDCSYDNNPNHTEASFASYVASVADAVPQICFVVHKNPPSWALERLVDLPQVRAATWGMLALCWLPMSSTVCLTPLRAGLAVPFASFWPLGLRDWRVARIPE
ncbi:MAG: hypothetical protein ACKVQA_26370 [Burkholderiales bacterium]